MILSKTQRLIGLSVAIAAVVLFFVVHPSNELKDGMAVQVQE